MTDDRENLPSASYIDQLNRCPGAWRIQQGLPEISEEPTTQDGTLIHKARETGDDSGLNPTQADINDRLAQMEKETLEKFKADFGLGEPEQTVREHRFWIRNHFAEKIASAKPDVVFVWPNHALVLNFKTGFGDLTPSELSWQSRTEALSVWSTVRRIEVIRAGFLASRLSSKVDTTDYSLSDLSTVFVSLQIIVHRSEDPDAPRVPGAHCRYCKARGAYCPDSRVYALVQEQSSVPTKFEEKFLVDRVAEMSPREMAFIYGKRNVVKSIFDAIGQRMKGMTNEELEPLGYKIKPGIKLTEIKDQAGAFVDLGNVLKDDERIQCLELVLGRAEDLLVEHYKSDGKKLSKQSAKEIVRAAIARHLEERTGNPRLVEL